MGDYISPDGKTVRCNRWAPKSECSAHVVNRALCFFNPVPEVCGSCKHNSFVYRIKINIGNQVVACPQFTKRMGWKKGETPVYVQMRREACLGQLPRFDFCQECPNRRPENPPQQQPGWLEVENEEEEVRDVRRGKPSARKDEEESLDGQ